MEKKKKLKEEELYQPVRKYLEDLGFTVNSEVLKCDVTAMKENLLLIVEMKTSLNLDVILQAVQRQKFSDLTYIAVPKNSKILFSKRWQNICHLLRRLEIGLMLVSVKKDIAFVEETIQPVPFDRAKSISAAQRKRKAVVKEIHERHGDYNTGGCLRKKLVTAYRESAIQIAVILKKQGPLSVKEIRQAGNLSDKAGRVLIDNHYGWFERIKPGTYKLSEKALPELDLYPELLEHYMRLLEE